MNTPESHNRSFTNSQGEALRPQTYQPRTPDLNSQFSAGTETPTYQIGQETLVRIRTK